MPKKECVSVCVAGDTVKSIIFLASDDGQPFAAIVDDSVAIIVDIVATDLGLRDDFSHTVSPLPVALAGLGACFTGSFFGCVFGAGVADPHVSWSATAVCLWDGVVDFSVTVVVFVVTYFQGGGETLFAGPPCLVVLAGLGACLTKSFVLCPIWSIVARFCVSRCTGAVDAIVDFAVAVVVFSVAYLR
jgi:uncharacterized OsmC-like protein